MYPGVRIINQILDKVCLLGNFHPISLDFFRQLQRWIGGYWLELLTGHVSIGKEYWSVIGSRHVIVGNAGPCVCSRRVSPNVPRMTSDQSIPPIHLCSYLKKSNEIGWKFAREQTLSSIWFIILTLFYMYDWMIDNIHQHCILGFHGQGQSSGDVKLIECLFGPVRELYGLIDHATKDSIEFHPKALYMCIALSIVQELHSIFSHYSSGDRIRRPELFFF